MGGVVHAIAVIAVGVAAGLISGMFGVGGAIVTTPAIRLLLGGTPAIALGTPLPVTIPSAAVGCVTYAREGQVEWRAAIICGLAGVAGTVTGSLITKMANLHYLMIVTALTIIYLAINMIVRGMRGEVAPYEKSVGAFPGGELAEPGMRAADEGKTDGVKAAAWKLTGIGYGGGFVSGLLGIGGGLIFIPSFIFLIKLPIKKAFGTSLAVITAVAIPGSVIHYFLGHIDPRLLLFLVIGVVPGAYLGARFSIWAKEAWLYIMFGLFIGGVGIIFLVKEVLALV